MEVLALQSKRMEYLLDDVITPSLRSEIGVKFKGLLEVMEQNEDVMFTSMAQKLGTYMYMLNKNTWGVKKCEANQKRHCKQACATKNSDIS